VGGRNIICNIVWLHGVVSARRRRFSLGYCCKGQGIFKIVPAASLHLVIVREVLEVNGECEFSRSCFLFSRPLNKATYESVTREYKLGVAEAQRLENGARRVWEALLEPDPGIVDRLRDTRATGGLLVYRRAPILLGKAR
jgi:hypothetical protein